MSVAISFSYVCTECATSGRIATNLGVLPCKCVAEEEVKQLRDLLAKAKEEVNK